MKARVKQNNPTKSATAYLLSTAERMLTECVKRQRQWRVYHGHWKAIVKIN